MKYLVCLGDNFPLLLNLHQCINFTLIRVIEQDNQLSAIKESNKNTLCVTKYPVYNNSNRSFYLFMHGRALLGTSLFIPEYYPNIFLQNWRVSVDRWLEVWLLDEVQLCFTVPLNYRGFFFPKSCVCGSLPHHAQ